MVVLSQNNHFLHNVSGLYSILRKRTGNDSYIFTSTRSRYRQPVCIEEYENIGKLTILFCCLSWKNVMFLPSLSDVGQLSLVRKWRLSCESFNQCDKAVHCFQMFTEAFCKILVQTILQYSSLHYSRIKPPRKGTEHIHHMLIQAYCRPFA